MVIIMINDLPPLSNQPTPSVPLSNQTSSQRPLTVVPQGDNPSAPQPPLSSHSVTVERTVNLSDFREEEGGPALGEVGVELSRRVESETLPMPADNLFQGTDLVIFRDSYNGVLPLNGIKLAEFNQITQLVVDIYEGRTKFSFGGDEEYKKIAMANIIVLLTRRLGRQLFQELLNKDSIRRIEINPPPATSSRVYEGMNYVGSSTDGLTQVLFNPIDGSIDMAVNYPSGERRRVPYPSYAVLGHELIHFLQSRMDHTLPPTLGRLFHNLDEQLTITGLANRILWGQTDSIRYNELNENDLLSAFGRAYRLDHSHADRLFKRLNDFSLDFTQAIDNGLLDEVDELLMSRTRPKENTYNRALNAAIKYDNVDKLKKWLSMKAAIFGPISPAKLSEMVIEAVKGHSRRVLSHLLTLVPTAVNYASAPAGDSLLHIVLAEEAERDPNVRSRFSSSRIEQIVDTLLQAGVDPTRANRLGKTPLQLASENGHIESVALLLARGGESIS